MKKTISILLSILIIVITLITGQIITNAITEAEIEWNGRVYGVPVDSTITCTCYLQAENIVSGDFNLKYPKGLKAEKIKTSNISNSMCNDVKSDSMIIMNFTNYNNPADFTTKKEILSVEFRVIDNAKGTIEFITEDVYKRSGEDLVEVNSFYTWLNIDFSEISYNKPIEEKTTTEATTEPPTEETTATSSTTEPKNSTETTEATEKATTQIIITEPTATIVPTEKTTYATEPTQGVIKKDNTIKVKTLKVKSIKKKVLKIKSKKVKPFKITKAKGNVTVSIVKKGTSKKIYKRIKINNKTGVVTFKKGTYAKKTYKIKFKIAVTGNEEYKPKTVNKSIRIRIK